MSRSNISGQRLGATSGLSPRPTLPQSSAPTLPTSVLGHTLSPSPYLRVQSSGLEGSGVLGRAMSRAASRSNVSEQRLGATSRSNVSGQHLGLILGPHAPFLGPHTFPTFTYLRFRSSGLGTFWAGATSRTMSRSNISGQRLGATSQGSVSAHTLPTSVLGPHTFRPSPTSGFSLQGSKARNVLGGAAQLSEQRLGQRLGATSRSNVSEQRLRRVSRATSPGLSQSGHAPLPPGHTLSDLHLPQGLGSSELRARLGAGATSRSNVSEQRLGATSQGNVVRPTLLPRPTRASLSPRPTTLSRQPSHPTSGFSLQGSRLGRLGRSNVSEQRLGATSRSNVSEQRLGATSRSNVSGQHLRASSSARSLPRSTHFPTFTLPQGLGPQGSGVWAGATSRSNVSEQHLGATSRGNVSGLSPRPHAPTSVLPPHFPTFTLPQGSVFRARGSGTSWAGAILSEQRLGANLSVSEQRLGATSQGNISGLSPRPRSFLGPLSDLHLPQGLGP